MSARLPSRRQLLGSLAALAGAATCEELFGLRRCSGPLGLIALARAAEAAPLEALREGGLAVLLRHAHTTPGAGDPPGYRLGDCATQRNLDDAGRSQAERVGQWFAKQGLTPAHVRNSPWCRCRDTARLAFGRSEDWPALGNIFGSALDPTHAAEVRRFVAQVKPGELAVLVSHGVTIAALSNAHPAPAEGVLVRAQRGGEALVVAGRLVVAAAG
jgi:phosphohistidine phosphatase SixA